MDRDPDGADAAEPPPASAAQVDGQEVDRHRLEGQRVGKPWVDGQSLETRQIMMRATTTFATSVLVIVLLLAGLWPLAVLVAVTGTGLGLWLARRANTARIDEAVAAGEAHDAAEAAERKRAEGP